MRRAVWAGLAIIPALMILAASGSVVPAASGHLLPVPSPGAVPLRPLPTQWKNLSIAPPGTIWSGAPMAYDPATREVVVVSDSEGPHGLGTCHTFTWAYKGGKWTNLTSQVTGAPPPMTGGGLVYDAADGYLVLYGGWDECAAAGLYETWTFHNNTWTDITATAGYPPVYRWFGMVYDARDGYVLLYGGDGASSRSHETWTFHAGVWSQLNTSQYPHGAQQMSMAYDPVGGFTLLIGGGPRNYYLNQTWKFESGKWTELFPHHKPPAPVDAVMVYDPTYGFLLYGGHQGNVLSNATWLFAYGDWTNVTPSLAHSPPIEPYVSDLEMAYDGARGQVILVLTTGYWLPQTWTLT